MSENEKFTVNDAICDMLEVLHTAGKISSDTYREELIRHGGEKRLPKELLAEDSKHEERHRMTRAEVPLSSFEAKEIQDC